MRTPCCRHTFCVWDARNVSDFVQKHFASATNVSQFAQHGNTTFIFAVPRVCAPKKHHEQQCVRNNVSSFAKTFTCVRNANKLGLADFVSVIKRVENYLDFENLACAIQHHGLRLKISKVSQCSQTILFIFCGSWFQLARTSLDNHSEVTLRQTIPLPDEKVVL